MTAYNVANRARLASGQPEDVSDVLTNLDLIASILNGSIDNSNINAAAAIAASKLAGYPTDVTKFLNGLGGWTTPATGAATVASTVAGLGTGVDGKVGRLRIGTTPYDFLGLIYDATYGKWVSEPITIWSLSRPDAGTGTNTSAGAGFFGSTGFPWKPYLAAGLTPQLQYVGMTQDASTSTNLFLYVDVYHVSDYIYPAAVPNDLTLVQQIFGSQRAQPTPNQWVGVQSNFRWATVTPPGSPKEVMVVGPHFDRANAQLSGTIYLRWVA